MSETPNLDRARAAWGDPLPDWVDLLARSCDASSQRRVADRLGKSNGYVNRLVSATYAGDLTEAEKLVRANLDTARIACPAFSASITQRQCLDYRRGTRARHPGLRRHIEGICRECIHNPDREA